MNLAREFETLLMEAMESAMKDAHAEAIRLSSGELSQRQSAAMDYAFARRHGTPLVDPSVINEQTGAFKQAWTDPVVRMAGSDIVGSFRNDSPVADFLKFGTRYMFRRPVDVRIEAYAQREIEERVALAVAAWDATVTL